MQAEQFCTITTILMAKLHSWTYWHVSGTCVQQKEKGRFRDFVSCFLRKMALIPITIKIIHVQPSLCVSVSLSPFYSFVSVCQSDCLTITSLVKLSGDEKSSLQSVQK